MVASMAVSMEKMKVDKMAQQMAVLTGTTLAGRSALMKVDRMAEPSVDELVGVMVVKLVGALADELAASWVDAKVVLWVDATVVSLAVVMAIWKVVLWAVE
jgi:hypothetical protein